MSLTSGFIQSIHNGEEQAPDLVPVLQVLSVKRIEGKGDQATRLRLILSDGAHFMQSMLSVAINDQVDIPGKVIDKNTLIKVPKYICNDVQNRRILIIIEMEFLEQADGRLGAPVALDEAAGAAARSGSVASAAADVKPDIKPDVKPKIGAAAGSKKMAGRGAGGGAPIYPIEGLSPYQNKWTIKARVTQKSDIRTWHNARGEGKLFSVNLLDDSGEIKATGFNDAVDELYNKLEEGKVYLISKARVNLAKKQFSNLSNEYEIMFEKGTEVEKCEDVSDVPQVKYQFIELGNLTDLEKDATCDVLGIVTDNGTLGEITSKATQKQIKKRDITIADRSGASCRLTLWGKQAENWVDVDNEVFAIKGARVGDFGGRTLSMGAGATMMAAPDIVEAHSLKGWFDSAGASTTFSNVSAGGGGGGGGGAGSFKNDEFKTMQQAKDEQLGMNDAPDFFSLRAWIVFVKKESISYPACPADRCNKKVGQGMDGQWRCEKCDKSYPKPEYRYVVAMNSGDPTSQMWISGFNETGQLIFGISADQAEELRESEGEDALVPYLKNAYTRHYTIGIKAKADTWNDQTRVRYQVTRASAIDPVVDGKRLLDEIRRMA